MMLVSEVAESMTVTKDETKKMLATPILYENRFFVCVCHTLYKIVRNELSLPGRNCWTNSNSSA